MKLSVKIVDVQYAAEATTFNLSVDFYGQLEIDGFGVTIWRNGCIEFSEPEGTEQEIGGFIKVELKNEDLKKLVKRECLFAIEDFLMDNLEALDED